MFIDIKKQIDSPTVCQILADCVFDNSTEGMDKVIKDYLRHGGWLLYGWVKNENIIGICGFEVHSDWLEILHIATCESARGRGVGSLMIAALQERYKMTIEAETDDDAVEFYRKYGFETTAIQKYNVRRWSCVLRCPN